MTFSVFLPPQAEAAQAAGGLVSVGPDLHPRQRHRKGRVSRRLRRARPHLRRARHQPARRRRARRSGGAWDFGQGAGFYVDATEEPWAAQLPDVDLCHRGAAGAGRGAISRSTWSGRAITGHSMGGHGALTVALRNPGRFRIGLGLRADRRAGAGAVGRKGAGRLSRRRPRGVARARCGRADRGWRAGPRTAGRCRHRRPVPRHRSCARTARGSLRATRASR